MWPCTLCGTRLSDRLNEVTMAIPIIAVGIVTFLTAIIIKGAPPVPTSKATIYKTIEITRLGKGDRMVDLGAGDGRVVIAFAKAGATARGYEINPILVLLARHKIGSADVGDRAKVYWGDFWNKDLSDFDIVNVFGVGHIMEPLAKKLKKELRPGTRVASNIFPIPAWHHKRKIGGIYLYITD